MTPPDFRTCPICGAAGFDLVSEERLYGYNRPTLMVSPEGALLAATWGTTEVDWSGSTTTRYVCGCCWMDLPEAYQRLLDAHLDNRRESD